ncbi:MAG: RsmB/NOP family class I SAM-dependent RNA methyltransferase [Saprospiraceae bacterium]
MNKELTAGNAPFRVHKSLLDAVINALSEIFCNDRKADKVLAEVLRSNKKWGSRDRGFIAESTYEIVRWWRLLNYINESSIEGEITSFQIKKVVGVWLKLQGADLSAFKEYDKLSRAVLEKKYEEARTIRKVFHSIPDWLDDMGLAELGEDDWLKELVAMNKSAPVTLRANTLKNSREDLAAFLHKEGIETDFVKNVPTAIDLRKRQNVFITNAFKEGRFEVQDGGSQLIGLMMSVTPGMRVIDACAGAGGKTLQLAAMMENKGQVIAMDTEEWKLEELKKRARRGGVHNIDSRPITGKVIKRLNESADRLLLDVPCSGLGTIRRNPDAKWKLKPLWIEEIKTVQQEIIQKYCTMLKVGGKMVYATCSILPSESENQVAVFLGKNPNFKLIEEKRTSTIKDGFDGFYMALIERI